MRKLTQYLTLCTVFCLFSLLFPHCLSARIKDSTIVVAHKADNTADDSTPKKHHKMTKPDQAALMSAIIPGLGQIGHHDSWWHVPIIYGGFAALAFGIYDNNNQYQLFRIYFSQRLKFEADNSMSKDPYFGIKEDQWLVGQRDDYRRNRDLLVMVSFGWYAANIIDAYVAAHLREFDIGNKLSMSWHPLKMVSIEKQTMFVSGFTFNLK
jgi:hypothetical protein